MYSESIITLLLKKSKLLITLLIVISITTVATIMACRFDLIDVTVVSKDIKVTLKADSSSDSKTNK